MGWIRVERFRKWLIFPRRVLVGAVEPENALTEGYVMSNASIPAVFSGHENGLVEKMSRRKAAEGARGAGADVVVLSAGSA
jgi:hypothetical protein